MATFYIISTTNAKNGWDVYGTFNSRKEAEESIDKISDFKDMSQTHRDIEAQTLLKNAMVVSKTAARKFGIDERYFENL
jgi:hypothetical protein